jgi:hypothetical protein
MEGLFGAEFPEAFGDADGCAAKSRKSIHDLPAEILVMITDHISKLDIKRLRLASKNLAENVDLRIDRVYISPNRANLECLQLILNHPRYKDSVREIIWDDAQLEEYPTLESFRQEIRNDEQETTRAIESRLENAIEIYGDANPDYRSLEREDLFQSDGRLTDIAKDIFLRYEDEFSRDILARNATMMSIEDSYVLYQDLYRSEQAIMKFQLDVTTLHQVLASFPKLRRVTVTTEVWRPWNVPPRYDTPFYRSLPLGFRKPSVWPWLGRRPHATHQQLVDLELRRSHPTDTLFTEYRGYAIVVSALVDMSNPCIEEFIIDSGNEFTGMSHHLLSGRAPYLNTISLFDRMPLKRLKFSINYADGDREDVNMHTRKLVHVLGTLQHLEHLDLDLNWRVCGDYNFDVEREYDIDVDHALDALKPRLKTLVLRNLLTRTDSLYQLITTLPSLEKITLFHIRLIPDEGILFQWVGVSPQATELFNRLQEYYQACSIGISRPSFTIVRPLKSEDGEKHYSQLVDEEIDAFVYDGQEYPFHRTSELGWRVNDRDESVRERMSEVYEHDEYFDLERWLFH